MVFKGNLNYKTKQNSSILYIFEDKNIYKYDKIILKNLKNHKFYIN
jgi:predicted nucleic acid-binding protein